MFQQLYLLQTTNLTNKNKGQKQRLETNNFKTNNKTGCSELKDSFRYYKQTLQTLF